MGLNSYLKNSCNQLCNNRNLEKFQYWQLNWIKLTEFKLEQYLGTDTSLIN